MIQPTDGVLAIGSGGPYALAAARALMAHTPLTPAEIVRAGLEIAGDLCIYTNRNIEVEELIESRVNHRDTETQSRQEEERREFSKHLLPSLCLCALWLPCLGFGEEQPWQTQ